MYPPTCRGGAGAAWLATDIRALAERLAPNQRQGSAFSACGSHDPLILGQIGLTVS